MPNATTVKTSAHHGRRRIGLVNSERNRKSRCKAFFIRTCADCRLGNFRRPFACATRRMAHLSGQIRTLPKIARFGEKLLGNPEALLGERLEFRQVTPPPKCYESTVTKPVPS